MSTMSFLWMDFLLWLSRKFAAAALRINRHVQHRLRLTAYMLMQAEKLAAEAERRQKCE